MLRFILRRETRDHHNDFASTAHITYDAQVPELEMMLRKGGSGPYGFDSTHLVGVEVLDDTPTEARGA